MSENVNEKYRYPVCTVHDYDIIELYEDNKYMITITGKVMRSAAPEWTGQLAVGDIVSTDNGKKRILSLEIDFPDAPKIETMYKVYIGNL